MTGCIYVAVFRYYDNRTHKTGLKKRPVLVIGKADATDYIVLPVSRVTARQYLHSAYDVKIDPVEYPDSNLDKVSYIRTHKQTVMRKEELTFKVSDFKKCYPEKYLEVAELVKQFQDSLYYQNTL